MPQSSTISRTLILLRGCSFRSLRNDALMARFVKFAIWYSFGFGKSVLLLVICIFEILKF